MLSGQWEIRVDDTALVSSPKIKMLLYSYKQRRAQHPIGFSRRVGFAAEAGRRKIRTTYCTKFLFMQQQKSQAKKFDRQRSFAKGAKILCMSQVYALEEITCHKRRASCPVVRGIQAS